MADVEIAVLGAGAVGLAVAARLAPAHPGLLLIDRNPKHGMETSSRNSQVVHAGLYYPPGTLKARLCVEGRERVYAACRAHDIPHARLGKLITATRAGELPALDAIEKTAAGNGVPVTRLSATEARALEPHVRTVGALLSPESGIVDAHALMDHFLRQALAAAAVFQPRTRVVGLEPHGGGYRVAVEDDAGRETFTAERVVNAAGLEADRIAALAGIDPDAAGYRLHWCKGSYFSAATRCWNLASRLIYPVPAHESLGVHVVLDTGGRLRFGPDAEYLGRRDADYRVDPGKRAAFAEAARRLLPDVRDDDLEPDIAGIRPKLQVEGGPFRDFVVAEESARGLPGFVNLVGIESPGLTAAPAIAEAVARLFT
ncbi:MAG TPA: NAD(P)/FAD-dependent oxidoreductase [Thermoanaerobaculia bacterium]|nr:NAD(P)/FAD-dependent oxidoreductase [Thermoanaerobaculia bacterium]